MRAYERRLVQEVLDILLPSIVDDAIFHMLRAIECEDIRVIYVADSGEHAIWRKSRRANLPAIIWARKDGRPAIRAKANSYRFMHWRVSSRLYSLQFQSAFSNPALSSRR